MTAPYRSVQDVAFEIAQHTQSFAELVVVREQLEAQLERMKRDELILSYTLTAPKEGRLEVVYSVPFEICRDLERVAALSQPLDALGTERVRVVTYATFPDES